MNITVIGKGRSAADSASAGREPGIPWGASAAGAATQPTRMQSSSLCLRDRSPTRSDE
jgi:hypothetical protein